MSSLPSQYIDTTALSFKEPERKKPKPLPFPWRLLVVAFGYGFFVGILGFYHLAPRHWLKAPPPPTVPITVEPILNNPLID